MRWRACVATVAAPNRMNSRHGGYIAMTVRSPVHTPNRSGTGASARWNSGAMRNKMAKET